MFLSDLTIGPLKFLIWFEINPVHLLSTSMGAELISKVTTVSKYLGCIPFACSFTAENVIIILTPRVLFRLGE